MDDSDERILVAAYKRAIRYAQNNDVAVFASSGNKGMNLDQNFETNRVLHLPGEIKGVNTIASVWNKSEASYSNYGSCVEFCAPGGDLVYTDGLLDLTAFIYVTYPTYMDNGLTAIGVPQGYSVSYGTSLSSAIATACFADIYSYGKEKAHYFRIDDALDLMTAGSDDLGDEGKDVHYGNGEINILKAENAKKHGKLLLATLAFSMIMQFMSLLVPYAIQNIVDGFENETFFSLKVLLAIVIGLSTNYFVFNLIRTRLITKLQTTFDKGFLGDTIQQLLDLPYSYFVNRSKGELIYT